MKNIKKTIPVMLLCFLFVGSAAAQEIVTTKQDILDLHDSIDKKKAELQEIKDRMQEYASKIAKAQLKQNTLANETALLDNRIAQSELDIKASQVEIDQTNLEITELAVKINDNSARIERQREILKDLLREIKSNDDRGSLEILLTVKNFSEFYSNLNFLEDVQRELQKTVAGIAEIKMRQEDQKNQQENKRTALVKLNDELNKKKSLFEDQRGAKEELLILAQDSEQKYQKLLRQLKEEGQFIDNEVETLQEKLNERIKNLDLKTPSAENSLFSWPISSDFKITTVFHDPSYPFRRLFEHSGLDMAVEVGTPVKSAAPGIVAAVKTGKLYGNYIIVMHAGGYATLYAHLSRMLISADQVVSRGAVIGLSGGRRGAAGSGLSTGPHLHFEVRADGVPINPLDYLISL